MIGQLLSISPVVDARSIKFESKRYQHDPEADRFGDIYIIVRNVILVSISPVIISFLFSIYRDPATPLIVRAIFRSLKRTILGDVSTNTKERKE